jgi:hypothetical protein
VRAGAVGLVSLATIATTAGVAQAAPIADYQLPFSCTQEWTGSTRSYHSPSSNAVDFNRSEDLGKFVLAAESGVVTTATDLGNRSYGKYIRISHGNDETTLYAHLNAMYVRVGQRVDQGQLIGTVGTSGGSTGPHLHFEERRGSSVVTPYFDGRAYRMPQTSASRNCVSIPVAGDWNNDGKAQLGVFRRHWGGVFAQKWGRTVRELKIGRGVDVPLVGDWDGDGRTDLGVRRSVNGKFVLRRSDGTVDRSIRLGGRPHLAVAGDWDGNGVTDVGIWRPGDLDFRIRTADGRLRNVQLGSAGTLPVTGDFNGDKRTDIGVFDAATATWTLRSTPLAPRAWSATVKSGNPGELPVTADWNGDGRTDIATWNRDTGAWSIRFGLTSTARTAVRYFGAT